MYVTLSVFAPNKTYKISLGYLYRIDCTRDIMQLIRMVNECYCVPEYITSSSSTLSIWAEYCNQTKILQCTFEL